MLAEKIVKFAIVSSQRSQTFSGRGGYSGEKKAPPNPHARSEIEFNDHEAFLQSFRPSGIDFIAAVRGGRVLDFGSGYGGRTAWCSQYAAEVYGIERYADVAQRSQDFCNSRGIQNCHFSAGSEAGIDFPESFFDVVYSYDVLEHVDRPDVMVPELLRVLRPGGLAFLAFTPYFGMFSHHLNYITSLPALHWFFSAKTLMTAVNDIIRTHPELTNVKAQPSPPLSYDGKRHVVPGVNGITKKGFVKIVRNLPADVLYLRMTPILEKFPAAGRAGATFNRWLCALPGLDEPFGHTLIAILRKRAASAGR